MSLCKFYSVQLICTTFVAVVSAAWKRFYFFRRMSVFSLIELTLLIFGTVWALIVGSVITAGLNETCQSFRDAYDYSKSIP